VRELDELKVELKDDEMIVMNKDTKRLQIITKTEHEDRKEFNLDKYYSVIYINAKTSSKAVIKSFGFFIP